MLKKINLLKIVALFVTVALMLSALSGCLNNQGEDTQSSHTKDTISSENESGGSGDGENIENTETKQDQTPEEPYDGPKVLTYDNMGRLSKGKNIVFFIVDRFDENYYESKIKKDPEFFSGLDGFTHFSDYTSLYCRTYPAIASILTGRDHDYEGKGSKESKLEKIFGNGGGSLGILKEYGYNINLYTEKDYVYTDASIFEPYADNVSKRESDEMFLVDETATANLMSRVENIEFSTNDSFGQFTFIHLFGCHNTKKTSSQNLDETFNLIYYYLDQMKTLGIYEDATVIITGDHAAALSDSKFIGNAGSKDDGTRVTAMFFKRSGESGTPLEYSASQVSQDELWNTIFESEGMIAEKKGDSFFDIPEGEDRVRRYLFYMYKNTNNNKLAYSQVIEYKITGTAHNSENWEMITTPVMTE